MSKGPGLFLDIGKKTKDLLTKDYFSDQKFSVSTYSDTGVGSRLPKPVTSASKGRVILTSICASCSLAGVGDNGLVTMISDE